MLYADGLNVLMSRLRAVAVSMRGEITIEGNVDMAKGQKKSNKEVRKPKKDKAPKQSAANPSAKGKAVEMTTLKS